MPEKETMERYIPLIQKTRIFQCLTDEDVQRLIAAAEIIRHEAGEAIISQGDISQHIYAVIKGRVDVSVGEYGEKIEVSAIGEGEMFGEAAIFIGEKRTANVTSSEDTTLLRIHKADLLSFIKTYPNAGIKILMLIISGLLAKLKEANMEILYEKQSYAELDDIDPMIQQILDEP